MIGSESLLPNEVTVEIDMDYQGEKLGGPAAISLKVNGEQVAEEKLEATVADHFGINICGIGEDSGQPFTGQYAPPFRLKR